MRTHYLGWPSAIPLCALFCLSMLTTATVSADEQAVGYDQLLGPYLKQYCLECHCEDLQEGDFRLDVLSSNVGVKDTALWAEVRERISSAEMPPEDSEAQPTPELSAQVVEWISQQIAAGESARMAQRQKVNFYRLSHEEYVNTVEDLLGVHYDANDPGAFTADPEWHGFTRIGSILSVSVSHLERYIKAAEVILDEAYPDKEFKQVEDHREAQPLSQVAESDREYLEANGLIDKMRWDMWPQDKHRYSKPKRPLPISGVYEMKIKLSGMKPANGRAPRLLVYHNKLDRVLFEQDVIAPEGEPVTLSFRTHLPAGSQDIILINDVPGPSNLPRHGRHGRKPFVSLKEGRIPWQYKMTDEQGNALQPFLILDWAEWRGPLISAEIQEKRDRYMPPEDATPEQRWEALHAFLTAAYRQPVTQETVDQYAQLAEQMITEGETSKTAMKTAMLAVLTSRQFLYQMQGDSQQDRMELTDWELASRLSYFLWSTMPDEELLAVASAGKLHEPEVLKQQLNRLLADPRSKRFTDGFTSQWLQLHKVGMFPPDKKLYPEYDAHLERSMIEEPKAFFRHVLENQLSIRELIDSDWMMLNPRLAIHYQMPQLLNDEFVRVKVNPESHRGGLLTQAGILSLTSDGTRHRPVHRGVWVSEVFLGKTPPPPPANVDPIEPNPVDSPKATLRMKLDAHKADPNCAACHQKIDPLGFAFDNYDAIGRWRTTEKVQSGTGANPMVDASGQLADGRAFENAEGFKDLMIEDIDQFSQTLVEKLATYGLRRAMSFEDEKDLHQIAQAAKAQDYQLKSLIENLVLSDLFRQR